MTNVIIVDPANSVLYLATSAGVYKSPDGGQTWTAASGISGDVRSLQLDLSTPANARILYAGVAGVGVFTSTDSGGSFNQILSAATPAVAASLAGGSFTRVVVALAPPTSPPDVNGVQVIYVMLAAGYGSSPDPIDLFVSTNQGSTWTQQPATGFSWTTYGGYALHMAVDPTAPGDGVHHGAKFWPRVLNSRNAGGVVRLDHHVVEQACLQAATVERTPCRPAIV